MSSEPPSRKQLKPRKAVSGPKGRGKVAKSDMGSSVPSVAAMQRIAEGQEALAHFLSKGAVTPQTKMALYQQVAEKSLTGNSVSISRRTMKVKKGVPTITLELATVLVDDFLKDVADELKEVFKNKAHVNVNPTLIEIALRVRRDKPESEPVKATAKKAARKSGPKPIKTKPAAKKKAPTAKKSKPAAKQTNGAQSAFPFPTSESQAQGQTPTLQ